jgi:hypothetical protein
MTSLPINMMISFIYYYCTYLQAENTFILALDGDVDFTPKAVRLLIDRMKKNEELGAACGRIHPIGKGRNSSCYIPIY